MTQIWTAIIVIAFVVAPLGLAAWLIARVVRDARRSWRGVTAERRAYLAACERGGKLTCTEFEEWWADSTRWDSFVQGAVLLVTMVFFAVAIAEVHRVARDLPPVGVAAVVAIGALLLFLAFWAGRAAIATIVTTRGLVLVVPLLIWATFAIGWAPLGWVLVIATGIVLGVLVLGVLAAAAG